jgi:hypothetical protein
MGRKARIILAHLSGLESKKCSGGGRSIFLDFTLYRTSQDLVSASINYPHIFSQKVTGPTENINSPGLATAFCLLHRLGAMIPARCDI